jgi:hypothetical protein
MTLVRLSEILTVVDLLNRWHENVTYKLLGSLIKNKVLTAYRQKDKHVSQKPGDNFYVYEVFDGELQPSLFNIFSKSSEENDEYDLTGLVFNREEIVVYEVKYLGHKHSPKVLEPLNNVSKMASCKTNSTAKKDYSKRNKHSEISQIRAAEICNVSERTIQNWENPSIGKPEGYPGRDNEEALLRFSIMYQNIRKDNLAARSTRKKKTVNVKKSFLDKLASTRTLDESD